MNAERLLAYYQEIAEARDAVDRLRRFILDLAVRGRLVPQQPDEEPASELLKRLTSESDATAGHGRIARNKPQEPIHEAPFKAPQGWTWMRLGQTGNIFSGNSINETTREQLSRIRNGLPFIATKDVGYGLDAIGYDNGLLVEHSDQRFKVARAGAVLICAEGGSAGKKIGLINRSICFGNKLLANETWSIVVSKFMLYVYMSNFFYEQFSGAMKGVIGGISIADFLRLPFCLPPLAEQNRIVAKVDELMDLCDELEEAQTARDAARDRLAAASLARLNTPSPKTFQADARFALDVLPAVAARVHLVNKLRQTIFNLAVQGKLVSQDPTEDSASRQLELLAVERSKQVAAGLIPRPKPSTRDSKWLAGQFPEAWRVIALGDACSLVTSGSRGWAEFYAKDGPGFIRAQNIRFGKLRLDDLARVNPPANAEGGRTQVAKGDLLVVITGAGVTNPALLDVDLGEAYVSQHVGLIRPIVDGLSRWFLVCLMADSGGRSELTERAYGAGKPGLNLNNLRSLTVPFPPLAEQRRIIAKLDQLTALCDELEASLTAADGTRGRLLEALLAEALSEPAVAEAA